MIRIVSLKEEPHIKETLMGVLEAEDSTGQHLASLILKRSEKLKIHFEDCRGQSYDNGANMRGKKQRCPRQTPGNESKSSIWAMWGSHIEPGCG